MENLRCGDWSAVIDPAHGANCISLRNEAYGASLLREVPAEGEPENPFLYGMPILFPVNRIQDGSFMFEERQYVFPINEPKTGCHLHGELHRTAFRVVEKSDTAILCRYDATECAPYLSFPHAFSVLMRYELRTDGLYHTVTVSNLSRHNMPLLLGFHTTFNTLFLKDSHPQSIRVLAEISEEYERNMALDYLPTGVKPPFDDTSSSLADGSYCPTLKKDSRHYRGNGRLAITDLRRGVRVVYENDEKYLFRLIYNGGDEGFICLEPQTCLANAPRSPFSREEAGFDFLKVGESKCYRSRIFMEEL